MGTWSGVKIKCAGCGMTHHEAAGKGHRRGIFHRNFRQIKRMLEDPRNGFADIGKEFGVTREFIRQCQGAINGMSGNHRRKLRRSAIDQDVWNRSVEKAKQDPRVKWVKAECERRCLKFEFVEPTRAGTSTFAHYRLRIKVNGHECNARWLYKHGGPHKKYLRVVWPTDPADFVIALGQGRCFIFPKKIIDTKSLSTTFAPEKVLSKYGNAYGVPGARHDYLDYENAWHLLK